MMAFWVCTALVTLLTVALGIYRCEARKVALLRRKISAFQGGAIRSAGKCHLGWAKKMTTAEERQAAASVGHADLMVLLTDQSGLFTVDSRARPDAEMITEGMAGGSGGTVGTGGMLTKIHAANHAARSGAATLIADDC